MDNKGIKSYQHKAMAFSALLLSGLVLSSCGGSSIGDQVVLEEGASTLYEFGEAFREGSLGIYRQGEKLASVSASMLRGFYTKVLTFNQNLTCSVLYDGLSLPMTYQVSSSYTLDQAHYSFTIGQEELSITQMGNPSKTDTELEIPSFITSVDAPLKDYPVIAWSASLGSMPALEKVYLSKTLKTFAPNPLPTSIGILPYSVQHPGEVGALDYDASGFLSWDKELWGISSSIHGALVLPQGDTSFSPNAFALPLEGVTSVEIPDLYQDLDFSAISKSLPFNKGFSCDNPPKGYSISGGFILYSDGTDSYVRGIPLGLFQDQSVLSFPEGITRFVLNILDGITLTAAQDVVLPKSLTSFSVSESLSSSVLETLELTSAKVVHTNILSIKNLPASLKTIRVPSSLLSLYQADSAWKNAGATFVGIE
jgi:hypothetical protein